MFDKILVSVASVLLLWVSAGVGEPQAPVSTNQTSTNENIKGYIRITPEISNELYRANYYLKTNNDLVFRSWTNPTPSIYTVTNIVYVTNHQVYRRADPFGLSYLVDSCGKVIAIYDNETKLMIVNSPLNNEIRKIYVYGFKPVTIYNSTQSSTNK